MNILQESPYFKDEETGELSKNALSLFGIIMCSGNNLKKVRALYDVLQDNNQDFIAAQDKDFPENFALLINLSCAMINEYEARYSGKEPEISQTLLQKVED